jgi:D-ribose pyranose/furanose isomerase RbsD
MARRRVIDPDFFLDEEVSAISPLARLLYIGLWTVCDDNYATLPYREQWIKVQALPYDSKADVGKLIVELVEIGKVIPFRAEDGERYLYLKNFLKHQRIDRPSKPKYPEYKDTLRVLIEDSTSTPIPLVSKEIKEVNKEVKEVYESYESIFKREIKVKNSDRNQKIKARLNTFSLDDIKKAFKNASHDAFLVGDNKENKFYATIDYFIRNDVNIEKYLDGASKPITEEEYQIAGKKVSKEEFEDYRRSL